MSGNDLPAFLPVYNLHGSALSESQRAICYVLEDAATYGVRESEQIRLVLSDRWRETVPTTVAAE